MISIRGKGVSRGVALGTVHFLHRSDRIPEKQPADDAAREEQRFLTARTQAALSLRASAESCRKERGEEAADLLETHALIAEDEDLTRLVLTLLKEERCTAEYAVYQAGETFARQFQQLEDAYMRSRCEDIRDVVRRILRGMTGAEEISLPDTPFILAANDLSPSETLNLNRKNILALITRTGSENSHSAILARSMGIPAVCSIGERLTETVRGRTACVDGGTGEVIIDPDERTLAEFNARLDGERQERDRLALLKDAQDVTLDGRRIDLYANVASPEDIRQALLSGARGIGLFRSEFLFLNADAAPSEETQFDAYCAAAQAMNGKRAVIRTLDIGADKQPPCLRLPREENPALGLRGVRLCLEKEGLFRTQLRALYRATASGSIAIMFPMISSEWEVVRCLSLCREVMDELRREGVPFRPETEIGVMIETPAAALIADRLARLTDFFSVGTNDLIQYTLACDRQNEKLRPYADPKHPAVMRLIRMAADAAHRAGIWIGVCGELAADPALLPEFLDMGVDELSVSPAALLPMRSAIRTLNA